MDETRRTIRPILAFEQARKRVQVVRALSRRDPELDGVWQTIDEYRQRLIYGLRPEDRVLLADL